MTDKCINSKLYRNRKLCANAQLKYREDVVLAAIFSFAFLKVNDCNDRMLSDRFSTPKLCKNKREKMHSNVEQSLMSRNISARAKYTHFQKSCNILSFKNIYAQMPRII